MAYAVVNNEDWIMAFIFLGNALGCVAVLFITAWKRFQHRRTRQCETIPEFSASFSKDCIKHALNSSERTSLPHSGRKEIMKRKLGLALFASSVLLSAVAVAQTATPGVMALTPSGMKRVSKGGLALAGLEQINLVGDPAKPGPYTLRLRYPRGFKIAPHTHPDSREVTILSGTFATGYGEKFDAANLKILPAGSFYTEPANVPHYIEIMEDAMLQISGMGPSGRKFLNPPDNPQ
jgi:hypothetical protein